MKQVRLILCLALLLVPASAFAQRDPPVSEIELKSALLARSINYRDSLPCSVPARLQINVTRGFQFLYLLHGLTGARQ